jgi:hypothetical protein
VGDQLIINGEEVIFKGWVDQSQTSIEVKAISDVAPLVRQIQAKEIKSLARSQFGSDSSSSQEVSNNNHDIEDDVKPSTSEFVDQTNSDRTNDDPKSLDDDDKSEGAVEPEETIETPQEPEYNAWEVWTYLERQRLKTLKLINTFQAEWEANRFVREAERSTPSNLRVHYEIRPVWLDEAEIMGSYQNDQASSKSKDSKTERVYEEYADAIDVEVIS